MATVLQQVGVLPGDGGGAPANKARADGGNLFPTIAGAINAADSLVEVGPGTYTEALTIDTDDLTIRGSGQSTRIVADSLASDAITVDASGVYIEDLNVRTSYSADNGYDAIHFTGTAGDASKVRNVEVEQTARTGIQLNGNDYIKIESVVMGSAREDHIQGNTSRTSVVNCRLSGADDMGVHIQGTANNVSDCLIRNIGDDAIRFTNQGCVATGNQIENVSSTALVLSGADDCVLADNYVNDGGAGADGVYDNGTNNTYGGNRFIVGGTALNNASATQPNTYGNNTN